MEGWLMFWVALNEGRKLHTSDEQFGQWRVSQLGKDDVKADDRQAAMWAAG
jgi:hypothetical protein